MATYNEQAVQFDAEGNLLVGPLAGEMANFRFDSRNRLVSAGETSYRYDAENQRIGVNQTNYVVNSQPALSQVLVKEESGVKTFYVYGLGLIGDEKDGEYRSYHFDYRGSTVALTDQTGKVVQRFQYGPYGELLKGEASQTPFLFNGKYGVTTDDNGLYYMRARFYSAVIKRFVNQDVLLGNVSEGQTLNRYAFVTGQPISSIDPTGNITWFIPPLIGLFLTVYDIVIPPTLPEGLEGDAIVPSVGPGDLLSTGIPLVSSLVKGAGVCNELASGGRILQKWLWGYKNITETQAEAAYAAIRDSKTDVNAIASYLRLNERSAERLRKIKDYLFSNSEWTGADPAIATAWQRLRTGRATAEDVLLLKHEVAEIWLRQNTSLAREEAHRRANKHYNWEFTVNDMEFWE